MSLALNREAIEAAPPPPPRPNPLRLLAQIWYRPRAALAAIAEGPGWLWVIPLALGLALLVARVYTAAPLQQQAAIAEQQRMQEQNLQNMPPEVRSSMPPEVFESPPPPLAAFVTLPLLLGIAGIVGGWLLRAGVLHLGSMLLGGRQSFSVLYRLGAWAGLPLILRDGVQAAYMRVSADLISGPGLAGLLTAVSGPGQQATSPAAILLARIDLYTVWFLFLLALAVMVAGKLTRARAVLIVVVYAVLALIPAYVPTLFTGLTRGF